MKRNNKQGSLGITVVMLVFCLMMSVSMSYHKTLQTELTIQDKSDNSDRAVDAAFSGINYAIATLQTKKNLFKGTQITITKVETETQNNLASNWICMNDQGFSIYIDDNTTEKLDGTVDATKNIPPYRFIVSCASGNYTDDGRVFVKSRGEFVEISSNAVVASYTAQLLAECLIDKSSKTIKVKRYKKVAVENDDSFYNSRNTWN